MRLNLLSETQVVLKAAGKPPESIVFIGSRDAAYACSWKEFSAMANVTYENTMPGQVIARDLVIVFSDGSSLSRVTDGSVERWLTDLLPARPDRPRAISRLRDGVDRTVAEMNP